MLLEIKDIKVSYGKIEAIKGISLNVGQGEIVTLVGANGAGKTTLLKTISGILKPSAGVISFEGKDIQSIAPHNRVLAGLCQAPEGRGIFTRRFRSRLHTFSKIKGKTRPSWWNSFWRRTTNAIHW